MSSGTRLRQKNAVAGPSNIQYDQEDEHITTLYNNPVSSFYIFACCLAQENLEKPKRSRTTPEYRESERYSGHNIDRPGFCSAFLQNQPPRSSCVSVLEL